MNPALKNLLQALHDEGHDGITEQRLTSGLQLLGAHQSCQAIVTVCRRFVGLADRYPGLNSLSVPRLHDKIDVLRRIATLERAPRDLVYLRRRASSLLKLYGQTADSPAAELLLVRHYTARNEALFDQAVAWFTWQAIRYRHARMSAEEYRKYIQSADGLPRPIARGPGAKMAAAFRTMRRLADPRYEQQLQAFLDLQPELTESDSLRITKTLIRARDENRRHSSESASVRQTSSLSFPGAALLGGEEFAGLLSMMRSLWMPHTEVHRRPGFRKRATQLRRDYKRLVIRHYGECPSSIEPVTAGGGHSGVRLNVHGPQPKSSEGECADEPDIPPPLVRLFLADERNFVSASIAQRGLRASVEYEAANLPYRRSRLSRQALDSLLKALRAEPCIGDEESTAGRLLVSLSLVTGRSLASVREACFSDLSLADFLGSHDKEADRKEMPKIMIFADDAAVVVRAGTPELVAPADDFLSPYLTERTSYLVLALPGFLQKLVVECLGAGISNLNRSARFLKAAKTLIAEQPRHLAITPKGIREALHVQLLRLSKGDLGIVKTIADGGGVNLANIIHYAAYDWSVTEGIWHEGVVAILGDDAGCDSYSPLRPLDDRHVGTPHRFRLEPIRAAFETLRLRFDTHLAQGAHRSAFNVLTLYTILWLNIATCSRGRLMPAPATVIDRRWALVLDKSRDDGSTDRLIPITDNALGQIRSYFQFIWQLSVAVPELKPLCDLKDTESLQFYWCREDGTLIKFRPGDLESRFAALIRLPGNWARKLVRQQAAGRVDGRFIDAALGHWVQGRAPWRTTSTCPGQDFARVWTDFQRELESKLRLKPLTYPQVGLVGPQWPVTSFHHPKKKKQDPVSLIPGEELEGELRKCDRGLFEFLDDNGSGDGALAVDLANRFLSSRNLTNTRAMEQCADQVCQFMRERWRVPIYREQPTAVLRDDHVMDRSALFDLANLERAFLPAFEADLAKLPAVDSSDVVGLVESGRMIAVLILKLGLHATRRLDGFLDAYINRPVLKTGDSAYGVFRCRGRHQNEFAQYTTFLTPWCRAYLVGQRKTLCQLIKNAWVPRLQGRTSRWSRALNAYCEFLGMPAMGRRALAIMMKAANQQLMLRTSPLLAAYARASFVTNDLDDQELRRLAGLPPRTGCAQVAGEGAGETVKSSGAVLPDVPAEEDRIQAMAEWDGPDVRRMIVRCGAVACSGLEERITQQFAQWLLADHLSKQRLELNPRDQQKFSERVRIVGYSLLARSDLLKVGCIDVDAVLAFEESSAELFPDVNTLAAWDQFVAWLIQLDCSARTELGLQIGSMASRPHRRANAKIVQRCEIDQLIRVLASPQSGIGNPATRAAAITAVVLEDTYGLRRSEAAMLRLMDMQDNVFRLQAYDDKRLKTRWAERLLLSDWLSDSVRVDLQRAIESGCDRGAQIISDDSKYLEGHNLFPHINNALKTLAGDSQIGQHNLRHRMASAIAFSALANGGTMEGMGSEFGWLDSDFCTAKKLGQLLGDESNAGQGLQALSATIGHSHPTTSLAHYVHTLGLALYSHYVSWHEPDLSSSFSLRYPSSNMSRWRKEGRRLASSLPESEKPGAIQRHILGRIERTAKSHIHIEESGNHLESDRQAISENNAALRGDLSFETLYRLEQNLWGEIEDIPQEKQAALTSALAKLATMKTGKRGSAIPRHSMARNDRGQPVPARLRSGSPTQCAGQVCEWLSRLHETDPELCHWLINAYVTRTDKRGRVRLDNIEEKRKAQSTGEPGNIQCTIARAPVSKKRTKSGETPRGPLRLQLHCLDDQGKKRNNDNEAIRWGMQLAYAQLSYVMG